MNIMKKEFSEDGWVMTESVGSVIFYLVMIGMVAALIYMAISGSKLSQMEQSLTTMAMQIQGLYSGSSSYQGLDNSLAMKSGAVPRKLLKGNTIRTPWGGNITVTSGSSDQGTFTIRLEGIKQEDCAKLGTYQMDMWDEVSINGSIFNSESNISNAVNACSSSANTIIYTCR